MPRSNPQKYLDQVAVWAGGVLAHCVIVYHVLIGLSTVYGRVHLT